MGGAQATTTQQPSRPCSFRPRRAHHTHPPHPPVARAIVCAGGCPTLTINALLNGNELHLDSGGQQRQQPQGLCGLEKTSRERRRHNSKLDRPPPPRGSNGTALTAHASAPTRRMLALMSWVRGESCSSSSPSMPSSQSASLASSAGCGGGVLVPSSSSGDP